MTIGNLKSRALSLARLSGDEGERLFSASLDAALYKIYSDLSVTGSRLLHIDSTPALLHIPRILHRPGETNTLPLSGRAYSLYVSGKGQLTVCDGRSVKRISFDSEEERIAGFIERGGEIELSGDVRFVIRDFCLFSDIVSDNEADIPDGRLYKRIDFSKYPDFLFFTSEPEREDGLPLTDCYTEGSCLFVPRGFDGGISVKYRKKAPVCNLSDKEELPLPRALLPLVLPLVISYILTDEDTDSSERYLAVYESMAADMKSSQRVSRSAFVLTNGWA